MSTRNPLGSIFERKVKKHGKTIKVWDVRKRYRDTDGKYKDRSKRCYTYAEALTALGNLPTDIQNKQAEKSSKSHTFFELLDYFQAEYVKPAVFSGNRKVSGYKQSLTTVRRYLDEFRAFFGDIPLESFNYEIVRLFSEKLASTKTVNGTLPAASTTHKRLAVLSRIFNVGLQLDWMVVNPMKRGRPLIQRKAKGQRNRMLTYEEEDRLLAVCDHSKWVITRKLRGKLVKCTVPVNFPTLRSYILLSLDTGMRLGEVKRLEWWQVDFERDVIYLTKEAAKQTKTGVAGILPITARLKDELTGIRSRSSSTGSKDKVLAPIHLDRSFRRACAAAGIEDLQYRDLRATGATRMLLAGNTAALVMKITRHTRSETFLNHYTGIDVANAQLVGQKLDRFNRKQRARGKVKGKVKNEAPGETTESPMFIGRDGEI